MARTAQPLIYEINTRCWLADLSSQQQTTVTLADVPSDCPARWARMGFTHVWLMGAWSLGNAAASLAQNDPDLLSFHHRHFPNLAPTQTIGSSPYAVHGYTVPNHLGGADGLAQFRRSLHRHGLKLILDFVPNHLALDHPWTQSNPEWFVQSNHAQPGYYLLPSKPEDKPLWLAHGRDPHFAPWTDTVQLDYRREAAQKAMLLELERVAHICDGVRCDMAMLLLPHVFARTWPPTSNDSSSVIPNFWASAIPAIKRLHKDFLFVAEVYWDMEETLQDLGFDFTYDKTACDLLMRHQPGALKRRCLHRPLPRQQADVHFLENHDEPRAAHTLSLARHRASALCLLTLPGMRLLHEGQLTGAKIQLPVQFQRRPAEEPQPDIVSLYEDLLPLLRQLDPHRDSFQCHPVLPAGRHSQEPGALLAYSWFSPRFGPVLIAVNLSDQGVSGRIAWEANLDHGLPMALWPLPESSAIACRKSGNYLELRLGPWGGGLWRFP